jgi:hypothetical protein
MSTHGTVNRYLAMWPFFLYSVGLGVPKRAQSYRLRVANTSFAGVRSPVQLISRGAIR